jgi:hypothetical protein
MDCELLALGRSQSYSRMKYLLRRNTIKSGRTQGFMSHVFLVTHGFPGLKVLSWFHNSVSHGIWVRSNLLVRVWGSCLRRQPQSVPLFKLAL